jgi:hypothetical protein
VFRSLENERSTPKLIEKVLQKTGVVPDPGVLADALGFLEMRHLFVHARGVIDEPFQAKYGSRMAALTSLSGNSFVTGARLPTRAEVVHAAVEAVTGLVDSVDKGLIDAGMISARC